MLPETFSTKFDLNRRLDQAVLDPAPLELNGVAPLADLGAVEYAIRCKINKPSLASIQTRQLLPELRMMLADQRLALTEHLVNLRRHRLMKICAYVEPGVVARHRFFNLPGREVRQAAQTILATTTEEVSVVLAVTPLCFGVDKAGFTASLGAPIAPQQALEVVMDHPVTSAAG